MDVGADGMKYKMNFPKSNSVIIQLNHLYSHSKGRYLVYIQIKDMLKTIGAWSMRMDGWKTEQKMKEIMWKNARSKSSPSHRIHIRR